MTELAAKAKMKQTKAKVKDMLDFFLEMPSDPNRNNLTTAILEHQMAHQNLLDARELNAFYRVTADQEAGLAPL